MRFAMPTVQLQYNVTRNFKWPWFGPISLLGGFIVFALLIIINVSLTGYESIVVFQDNFNATDSLWFYRLMPFRRPKPGTLCDPHVFRIGDMLTTNYSYFQWSIDTISIPNAGTSSLSYTGTLLSSCDIAAIYLNGDLHSWTIDYSVVVACQDGKEFAITAKTSFTIGLLPGRYSQVLGLTRYLNALDDGSPEEVRGGIIENIIEQASQDLGNRVYNAFVGSNFSTPTVISLRANFRYCPLSLGPTAECSINPPAFAITSAAVVYANASVLTYDSSSNISDVNPWVLDDDSELPIHNIIESVYAAIRVDLGNPSSNNFILNRAFLDEAIYPTFPETKYNSDAAARTSTMYAMWKNPDALTLPFLPITVGGPAQIQLAYACRFQQRKYIGPLIVSVMVATLSMFSSAWAIYILVASGLAKRQDASSNRCEGHCFGHDKIVQPSWFDGYDAYGIHHTDNSPLHLPKNSKHGYQSVTS